MSSIVGIDFKTACIDLVKLPLDDRLASWLHITLPKKERGVELARTASLYMRRAAPWFNGALIVAIEKPMSPHRNSLSALMRLQGAIASGIFQEHVVWELPPEEWKQGCGLSSKAKIGEVRAFTQDHEALMASDPESWSDDACAAFCIAWASRAINERGTAE